MTPKCNRRAASATGHGAGVPFLLTVVCLCSRDKKKRMHRAWPAHSLPRVISFNFVIVRCLQMRVNGSGLAPPFPKSPHNVRRTGRAAPLAGEPGDRRADRPMEPGGATFGHRDGPITGGNRPRDFGLRPPFKRCFARWRCSAAWTGPGPAAETLAVRMVAGSPCVKGVLQTAIAE
jgi:hypothetical protein